MVAARVFHLTSLSLPSFPQDRSRPVVVLPLIAVLEEVPVVELTFKSMVRRMYHEEERSRHSARSQELSGQGCDTEHTGDTAEAVLQQLHDRAHSLLS